ncbi:MAG: Putative thiol-disulfide isomerase [Bacteroidetes bacterium 38_7]|nr:MAG: Putative thiol-disulfide isomerase [Bacteroidetes bacterium 38_7]
MRNILFLLMSTLFFFSNEVLAQNIQLKVRIKGAQDNELYLAHYFADKQYMDDTLRKAKGEWFVLEVDSMLPGGLYIIAGEKKNRYFEFLIHNETRISFETTLDDPVNDMQVKGSPENIAFFQYVQFLGKKQKEIEPWQKIFRRTENLFPDSANLSKIQLQKINEEVLAFIRNFIKSHEGMLVADFVKASQEPEIPDPPVLPNGRPDSLFAYKYYKAHYFDNLPLNDARLLRTPFYHQRVNNYFSKMVLQHPDSIIAEAKRLIPIAKQSPDTYRYMIWFLTNYTERSEIMGMDAAFVYMVENFYATGEMDFWINQTVKENLIKKAKKLKPILIGQTAPELIMLDTLMQAVSLHQVKAKYTILLFWDPSCGHCKKEIPVLKNFIDRKAKQYDIKVFAVCSDTNMAEMKKYIRQYAMDWINVNGPRAYTANYHDLYDIYSTPVMYLLDEKKTILAKRLTAEQIESFIEHHSRAENIEAMQMKQN